MKNTERAAEDLDNLQRAASIDPERSLLSVSHLLGYRQRVAQEILKGNHTEGDLDQLNDLLDYTNDNIKKALGLK